MISDGKYSVSMYAIKDIKENEELTFDYCSMTESEEEMLNSHCLCGSKYCKDYYLRLTQTEKVF